MARFIIYAKSIHAAPYNNCYRVVVLEKTVPSKNLLKVRLIVWQQGLPRIRIRIKNAAEIDCRELVQIVQPPVTTFLLGMLGEADDKFDEVGIIPIISSRTALVKQISAVVRLEIWTKASSELRSFIRNLPVYSMTSKIHDLDSTAGKNPRLIIEHLQDLWSA
uniref:(northern house mosquito) hypothetical protein n=1 Tax=Culex pipiens TaxID=7175 RepID=A0A8D8C3A8_CULPI